MVMPNEPYDPTTLRKFIVKHFDWEELRTLCQDLEVDFDSLHGEGKAGKARELVAYMQRHTRLNVLATALQKLRPGAWEEEKPLSVDEMVDQRDGGWIVRAKAWWQSQSDTVRVAYIGLVGTLLVASCGLLKEIPGKAVDAWLGDRGTKVTLTHTPTLTLTQTNTPTASSTPTLTPMPPTTSSSTVVDLANAHVNFTISLADAPEMTVPASGTLSIAPGAVVLIEMKVTIGQSPFPRDLTYWYSAPRGSIPEKHTGPSVSYVAPEQPGPDVITVSITDQETGEQILRSIKVVVD